MRAQLAFILLMLVLSAPARADFPGIAVFDFELVDTSLEGEVNGPRTDERNRLMRVGDQLRKELAPLEQCDSRRHPHPNPPPQAGEGAQPRHVQANLTLQTRRVPAQMIAHEGRDEVVAVVVAALAA